MSIPVWKRCATLGSPNSVVMAGLVTGHNRPTDDGCIEPVWIDPGSGTRPARAAADRAAAAAALLPPGADCWRAACARAVAWAAACTVAWAVTVACMLA